MSAPSAGSYISGSGASLCLEAPGSMSVLYWPFSNFVPGVDEGKDVIPLVNNEAFPCNEIDGLAYASFDLALPLIPSVVTASFLTTAFCSGLGDDDNSNYWVSSLYPDNRGSAAKTYARMKFGSYSGSVRFNRRGAATAAMLRVSGLIGDPESTATSALAAPSAGALSTANVVGFAQMAITGATEVAQVSWNVTTGLDVSPGKWSGTNSNFPQGLIKGCYQGANGIPQSGVVYLTQPRVPTTRPGATSTITVSLGVASNGVAHQFELLRTGYTFPSNLGPNLYTSQYLLKSLDGSTYPFTATAM